MTQRVARTRDESGYAALLVSVLLPVVFLGLAALSVDVARWYVEVERVQKAADAAALGGVTYMPQDFANARATATEVSSRNGYPNSGTSTVTVAQGARASELRVTVSSRISNAFGALLGFPEQTITRSALTDFTGPAPMGSPCNTFGNEPPSNSKAAQPSGTALPSPGFGNCSSKPDYWALIQGPKTGKTQGDRYSTLKCGGSFTDGCSSTSSSANNLEYKDQGYFFVVRVLDAAKNTPIKVQLYDPAYVNTGTPCNGLPDSGFVAGMNDFVGADAAARYDNSANVYCSGDGDPGGGSSSDHPVTTSFTLREQTDTLDPLQGAPISGCTKQFRGFEGAPSVNNLKSGSGSYNQQMAKVFHQWADLCTFTPTRKGDYYLQVRSNVPLGGTFTTNTAGNAPVIYSENPAVSGVAGTDVSGRGSNKYAVRAVTTPSTLGTSVSVAGWERMPMFANAPNSEPSFNLIRVLPGAGGKSFSFNFFDVGEAATTGATVTVLPPMDVTAGLTPGGTIPGCTASGPVNSTNLSACSVSISSATHDGKIQNMVVPVPSGYNCQWQTQGGCWFRVKVSFPGASQVNDSTTWDASIKGDPVRLIE